MKLNDITSTSSIIEKVLMKLIVAHISQIHKTNIQLDEVVQESESRDVEQMNRKERRKVCVTNVYGNK